MFVNIAAPVAPLLVADKSHATFSNCLFRTIHLPHSELLDLSGGGTATLRRCRFADFEAALGLVDTSFNDYTPLDAYNGNFDTYGGDDMPYEVALAPAPEADRVRFGAEWVVWNDTVSDCLGGVKVWDDAVVRDVAPGCPAAAGALRRDVFVGADPVPPPLPQGVAAGAAAAGATRDRGAGARQMAGSSHHVYAADYYVLDAYDYTGSDCCGDIDADDAISDGSGPEPGALGTGAGSAGGDAPAQAATEAAAVPLVDPPGPAAAVGGASVRVREGLRGRGLSLEDPWLVAVQQVSCALPKQPYVSPCCTHFLFVT